MARSRRTWELARNIAIPDRKARKLLRTFQEHPVRATHRQGRPSSARPCNKRRHPFPAARILATLRDCRLIAHVRRPLHGDGPPTFRAGALIRRAGVRLTVQRLSPQARIAAIRPNAIQTSVADAVGNGAGRPSMRIADHHDVADANAVPDVGIARRVPVEEEGVAATLDIDMAMIGRPATGVFAEGDLEPSLQAGGA